MKIVKRITNTDVDPEIRLYLLSDGTFLIHAVKQQQFETRLTKKHEHPILITREPWELYDVTINTWVFKRQNENKEQMLILREVARMRLSEFIEKGDKDG